LKLIDFEKAKNEIIREIAESRDFHNVVKHICYKNGYSGNTQIIQDIKQEVIEKMLKKDAEEIYTWYVDEPKRPFAVAYGIAKKQFLTHPTLVGYNKQSFGTYISFTSNLKMNFEITDTDRAYLPQWVDTAGDEENDINEQQHIMLTLMEYLTPPEVSFLKFIMNKDITKGKYTKDFRDTKEKLFEKIRQIAKAKNIKVIF